MKILSSMVLAFCLVLMQISGENPALRVVAKRCASVRETKI